MALAKELNYSEQFLCDSLLVFVWSGLFLTVFLGHFALNHKLGVGFLEKFFTRGVGDKEIINGLLGPLVAVFEQKNGELEQMIEIFLGLLVFFED